MALAEILARSEIPLHLTVGNHDRRQAFLDTFAGAHALPDPNGFVQYAVDVGNLRLVVCDSLDENGDEGAFCEARAAWLASSRPARSSSRSAPPLGASAGRTSTTTIRQMATTMSARSAQEGATDMVGPPDRCRSGQPTGPGGRHGGGGGSALLVGLLLGPIEPPDPHTSDDPQRIRLADLRCESST